MILRQVPALDPAAGLLVVVVAVVVVAAVPVLVFSSLPVVCALVWLAAPFLALLPEPSSAWSYRLPPVRIAAGVVVPFGVVVAVAQVVPVVGKEQGGPGRFTWCQACCPPGGARQLLHLVPVLVPDRRRRCRCPPGAGRVILRQLPGLDPAAGLLVGAVALAAVVALVALFFAPGLCPGPVRCAVPGPAAGRRRCAPAAGRRPCGLPPG